MSETTSTVIGCVISVAMFIGATVLLLTIGGCATSTPQSKLLSFNEVKHGLRADCVKAPSIYGPLNIAKETCQYNEDPTMPAACVFLGRDLMPNDTLMVCGAVLMQDSCMAKWRATTYQCSLPVEQPENPLNEDK